MRPCRSLILIVAGLYPATALAHFHSDGPAVEVVSETLERGPEPVYVEPTLEGPSGLFRLPTADVGSSGQLKLALRSELFQGSDLLVIGDSDDRVAARVVIGATILSFLETWAVLSTTANHNDRQPQTGESAADAKLVSNVTDLGFGAKARVQAGAADLAALMDLAFLGSPGGLSFDGSATSVQLRGVMSVTAERLGIPVPFRMHVSLGQAFDNSRALIALQPKTQVSRQVVTFAYRLRPSRFLMAFGFDVPLRIGKGRITPIFEYHLDVATDDGEPAFEKDPFFTKEVDGRLTQSVLVGLRGHLSQAFSVDAGFEVGVSSPGFAFGPPVLPWNFLLGVSYAFEPFAPPPRMVRTVRLVDPNGPHVAAAAPAPAPVAAAPAPAPGPVWQGSGTRITGVVKNSISQAPIANAILEVPGQGRIATNDDGTFRTPPIAAGNVQLAVRARGFESQLTRVDVGKGRDAYVELMLSAKAAEVELRGKVKSTEGGTVTGTIRITRLDAGTEPVVVRIDSQKGTFAATLTPGVFSLRPESEGFLLREQVVRLAAGPPVAVEIQLRPRGADPLVGLARGKLLMAAQVKWKGNTAQLLPESDALLDEVADLLLSHLEWKRIRVISHTDPAPKADELTQERAKALCAYLTSHGVAPGRLEPVGAGAGQSIAPNTTPAGKARNRRVEIQIGDLASEGATPSRSPAQPAAQPAPEPSILPLP